MQSICVYLGAKSGNDILLSNAAAILGAAIADAGYRLVYGGSSKGLLY